MQYIQNVQGSSDLAVPLIIGLTTIYVKENIHKLETEDESDLWEWNEYQYSKEEYFELMSHQSVLSLSLK